MIEKLGRSNINADPALVTWVTTFVYFCATFALFAVCSWLSNEFGTTASETAKDAKVTAKARKGNYKQVPLQIEIIDHEHS
jgi:hypothetical protein